MREMWHDDPTSVRFADLSAASAAVVRFRRRRRATLAGAVSLALVVVVSSRAVENAAESSLVPTDSPTATYHGASPAPSPEPTPAPTPTASPGSPGSPGTAGQPPPGPGSPSGTVVAPGYTPVAEPGAPADSGRAWPPARAAVVRTHLERGSHHKTCAVFPVPAGNDLCPDALAWQDSSGGYGLSYTVCQDQPSFADVKLEFTTAREVDFAIKNAGKRIVWQWSTGQRFPRSPHTVTVGREECVEWRTHWNGLLNDGSRPPPGKYTLRAAGRESDNRLRVKQFTFDIR